MDYTGILQNLAGLCVTLPEQSVEDLLVSYDAAVGAWGETNRPAAAEILRRAGESSQDLARRERLRQAADGLAAGQPCAFTKDGLTAQQAAAALHAIPQAEWERRIAEMPNPVFASDIAAESGEDEPEDEEEDEPYMEEPPPALPHLGVRHFFQGLVVRVARDFYDADVRAVCRGDLLKLLRFDYAGHGCTLDFLECKINLSGPARNAIIENAGNGWFQPVPTVECLEALRAAIDKAIDEAEDDLDEDDEDGLDRMEGIREGIERASEWLSRSGDRGPAPLPSSIASVVKIFGRGSFLAVWIPLFYAGIAAAIPGPQ